MRGISGYTPGVRLIAATVLVFFAWSTVEMHRFVVLAQTVDAGTSAGDAAFQAMDDAVAVIEGRMDAIDTALAAGADASPQVAALDGSMAAVDAADTGVRRALDAIGQQLEQRGAPPLALQRHAEFVASYDTELRAVREQVTAVRQSPGSELKVRVDRARGHLKERRGRPHTPIDPQDLPRRQAKPKDRAPRLRPEEFADPLRVASAASPFELLAAQEAGIDEPSQYLGETIDAPFSQGIRDLATSLGGSPVAIYNWVRQNIAFVPTYGSIQGAEACRLSRECNAHDTASLLVALLRVSGVPARYVVGTIETPPALFRRAMGDFPDVAGAARLASSGGIPVTVVNGGSGTIVGVRMEHVWIEAHVDYVPSRGVARGAGDTWVPLDAALKPARFQAPTIPTAAGVDGQAIFERLRATATIGDGGQSITSISPTAVAAEHSSAMAAMRAYIDNVKPDTTFGELLGSVTSVAPPVRALPASLPGRVLVAGARLAALPTASRHLLTLTIRDQFGLSESLRVQRSLVELAGRRFTIAFLPATVADRTTIDSFGGLYQTPGYLVNVRPVVYLDGSPVATGAPVRLGTIQRVNVAFREPDGSTDSVEHQIVAGTFAAVGLDLQRVMPEAIEARRAKLNATRDDILVGELNFDDMAGELLHLNSLMYFFQVEWSNRGIANQLNVMALKRPAEMLATLAPSYSFVFGSATTVRRVGMNVDVRRYIVSVSSRSGDRAREIDYMFASGSFASAHEHSVFEWLQNVPVVSAIQLIAEASNRGIPIYSIDAANAGTLLPQLRVSSAVLNDVRNSVAAGKQVLIPRDEIAFFQWRGSGYIVLDPATGAAGYLISGGLAGGGTADLSEIIDAISNWLAGIGVSNDLLSLLASGVKFLAKGTAYFEAIGKWLVPLSAAVSAISMYLETGSFVKAGLAALADLALSAAAGWLVGVVAMSGASFLAAAIAIVTIAYVAFLVGQIISQIIASAFRFVRRRRSWLARARPADPWRTDIDSSGIGGFAWGIA